MLVGADKTVSLSHLFITCITPTFVNIGNANMYGEEVCASARPDQELGGPQKNESNGHSLTD